MDIGDGFDPAVVLDRIVEATGHLLETAARFGDADVREPSLLPGWSRGHVLTHLARNADGGTRLLRWARTGIETPEYPSMTARAQEIEAGAGRGAAELLADVRDSSGRFAGEYARMPAHAWRRTVRWTGGQQHPAARAADSRLCEVLVHHVDLGADYTAEHWPVEFTEQMLSRVVGSLAARSEAPAVRLHAMDTGSWYVIGDVPAAPVVRGPRASLLAWLMGRSPGADLATDGGAALPAPPFLY